LHEGFAFAKIFLLKQYAINVGLHPFFAIMH
jgi:hypothetical protein